MKEFYPKPKKMGGTLIVRMILFMRSQGLELPLKKVILTDSGGSDSHALTHLIVKYGRRIVSPENITIVHINHGWRGAESDQDEVFVKDYAESMGVEFKSFKLTPPTQEELKNESPENLARIERKRIYESVAGEDGVVFTAHHADDLFETMLWRLCEGKIDQYGQGILFKTGNEIRPLLTTKKEELSLFLEEEGLSWREDSTNHEGKLLRSKMRMEITPHIQNVFPKAVDKMIEMIFSKKK